MLTLEAGSLQSRRVLLRRAEPLRCARLRRALLRSLPRARGLSVLLRTSRLLLLRALPVGGAGLRVRGRSLRVRLRRQAWP